MTAVLANTDARIQDSTTRHHAAAPERRETFTVEHHTSIQETGEGSVQATCTCGWQSQIFGNDKTTGTMDPLQQAQDACDLHKWDASLP